jgi:hypothetical protein
MGFPGPVGFPDYRDPTRPAPTSSPQPSWQPTAPRPMPAIPEQHQPRPTQAPGNPNPAQPTKVPDLKPGPCDPQPQNKPFGDS